MGLNVEDRADCFYINPLTNSRIFITWINLMYVKFKNCLYRCPGLRWTNGTMSQTSSHCHLCSISADLHALSEEPPKVQLDHLALEAADLASEDHIPVTRFDAFASHTLLLVLQHRQAYMVQHFCT